MTDIRILHAQETQAFACRVAAALAAAGHSVRRSEAGRSETGSGARANNPRSAEPLVVVWSPQMLESEAAINEARAALGAFPESPMRDALRDVADYVVARAT